MHLMRKLPFLTINGFDQSWVASWVSFHIPQSHCHHRQHLEQAFKIHIWFSETSPVLRMPSSRNFEVQAKAICREASDFCKAFKIQIWSLEASQFLAGLPVGTLRFRPKLFVGRPVAAASGCCRLTVKHARQKLHRKPNKFSALAVFKD